MGEVRHPRSFMQRIFFGSLCLVAVQVSFAGEPTVEPRIIGGTDAIDEGFPFAVQITINVDGTTGFCGGSLLAPRWVLTAGHCAVDDFEQLIDPSAFTVLAGTQEIGSTEGESVGVTNVYLHPDFFVNTINAPYNDLALLELTLPVSVGTTIVLPHNSPAPGTLATVVGWGVTSNDSVTLAETLQEADVPVVSNDDCSLEYPGLITDATLCAGYTDREIDACIGDSGGPLMVEVDGVCQQVGIVSFGLQECATTYGVYTRVPNYTDWVYQFVDPADAVPGPCSPPEPDDGGSGGGGGAFGAWWFLLFLGAIALVPWIGSRRSSRRPG